MKKIKKQDELELIMNLMDQPITKDSLKQIREMNEKTVDTNYVRSIEETTCIKSSALFLPSPRIILVNYSRMNKIMEQATEILKIDTKTNKHKDKKLIKLLTIYRILLHEIHHSKQIYNVFDECKEDIESEIIRSIYNIDKEEYKKQLKKTEKNIIIEETTRKTNNILRPYSEINPIERKAEIESYKKIIELITPIKEAYPKVYNEIKMQMLFNRYNGYQYGLPYEQTLEILKMNRAKYKLPYNSENMKDFFNTIQNKTTEIERMELGLKVSNDTINNTISSIQKILAP